MGAQPVLGQCPAAQWNRRGHAPLLVTRQPPDRIFCQHLQHRRCNWVLEDGGYFRRRGAHSLPGGRGPRRNLEPESNDRVRSQYFWPLDARARYWRYTRPSHEDPRRELATNPPLARLPARWESFPLFPGGDEPERIAAQWDLRGVSQLRQLEADFAGR